MTNGRQESPWKPRVPSDLGTPQASLAPRGCELLYWQKPPVSLKSTRCTMCSGIGGSPRGQGGTQPTRAPALLELLTACWHGCRERLSIPEGLSSPCPREERLSVGQWRLAQGQAMSGPGALHHFLLLTVGLPSGLIQLSTLEQRVAVTKGFFRHNPTKRRQSCYVSRRQELRL